LLLLVNLSDLLVDGSHLMIDDQYATLNDHTETDNLQHNMQILIKVTKFTHL